MSTINTVGVIGAGTMGNGIAQACAAAGINAIMIDVSEAALQKGASAIAASLERLVKKDKLSTKDRDATLARVTATTSYDALRDADLVIEAATENPSIKVDILRKVDALARQDAVIATNTSSISITQLAAMTQRARPLHRHALLQPGAADGPGRADPRPADLGRDGGAHASSSRSSWARRRSWSRTAPGSSSIGCCARC